MVHKNARRMPQKRGTTMSKIEKSKVFAIPPIAIRKMEVTIVGDSPLVCHRFSQKVKDLIRGTQEGKARQKLPPKVPWNEYVDALYWISQRPAQPTEADVAAAEFGFPAIAIKKAAVSAANLCGMAKTDCRMVIHIDADLLRIEGSKPEFREDSVRLNGRTADMRYRPSFTGWRLTIPISFNANAITGEQVLNLLNMAGYSVGIGEYRPEKGGCWGRFHVATDKDQV
jgi:hypothetical protein